MTFLEDLGFGIIAVFVAMGVTILISPVIVAIAVIIVEMWRMLI